MVTYDIYQLKNYAKKFLKDNYNLDLVVPLSLNGRMQRTCGWFKYTRSGQPVSIELNKFFVENNDPTTVLDVLRHECIHYALFMQGKPNKDGHPVFENELNRLGVVSQKTINKYDIESKPRKQTINMYKCVDCDNNWNLKRALKHNGAMHKCGCGGKIAYLGKKSITV